MVRYNRKQIAENIYEVCNIRRIYAEEINQLIDKQLKKFRGVYIEYKNKLFSNLKNNDRNTIINLFAK